MPRAGKRFTVRSRLTLVAADDSRLTLRCRARIGRSPAQLVASSTRAGVARCTWAVPSRTAGRKLRATVEAVYGTDTAERRFSRRVVR